MAGTFEILELPPCFEASRRSLYYNEQWMIKGSISITITESEPERVVLSGLKFFSVLRSDPETKRNMKSVSVLLQNSNYKSLKSGHWCPLF